MPPQAKLALKPFAFLAFFFLATLENRSFAAEWNQFRGPSGQGTVETDQLPLQWSEEQNIGWKKQPFMTRDGPRRLCVRTRSG